MAYLNVDVAFRTSPPPCVYADIFQRLPAQIQDPKVYQPHLFARYSVPLGAVCDHKKVYNWAKTATLLPPGKHAVAKKGRKGRKCGSIRGPERREQKGTTYKDHARTPVQYLIHPSTEVPLFEKRFPGTRPWAA